MVTQELELRSRIDGYKIAIALFLEAGLPREEMFLRFVTAATEARRRAADPATIDVLESIKDQLSPWGHAMLDKPH
jgi:hypothetical protein